MYVPHPRALPIIKQEAKVIMNLNIHGIGGGRRPKERVKTG
jgi:hypothetical protein